jgi:hypothetical protein
LLLHYGTQIKIYQLKQPTPITIFSKNEYLPNNVCHTGFFFLWLQNMEGEPVVGGWLQIHQPHVLPPYFAARKKNPDVIPYTFQSVISHSINPLQYRHSHFGQFTNSIYLVASFQFSFLPIQLILYIFDLLSNFP